MKRGFNELRIFISSPSDVQEERRIAKSVIEDVARTCKRPLQLYLDVVRWEDLTPMASSDKSIQEKINETVKSCHVFVLILYKRFGQKEEGYEISNTEREIQEAFKLKERNKKIKFLAYFRDIPENTDPGDQEMGVKEMKDRLVKENGVLYMAYKEPKEFASAFVHHLYDTALKFRFSTFKVSALDNFWQFGIPDRHTDKKIAILYPTMDFSYLAPTDPKTYWKNRMIPQVLFEDMQALTKIEKTLRMIGAQGFGFYSVDNAPSEIKFMNRIWVCQARNKLAEKYHNKHKHKLQHYFRRCDGNKEAVLHWRYSTDTEEYFSIRSPLSKYLTEQRREKNDEIWTKDMGLVIAKDYGVLARIRCDDDEMHLREGYMYDYFVSGIRGLGTWGVAYFIDRNYKALNDFEPNEDVQILIEVTYKDQRIFDVRDVSNEPEHYFRTQNSLPHIRKVIAAGGEDG